MQVEQALVQCPTQFIPAGIAGIPHSVRNDIHRAFFRRHRTAARADRASLRVTGFQPVKAGTEASRDRRLEFPHFFSNSLPDRERTGAAAAPKRGSLFSAPGKARDSGILQCEGSLLCPPFAIRNGWNRGQGRPRHGQIQAAEFNAWRSRPAPGAALARAGRGLPLPPTTP
jgi:hypothetical protein